MDPQESNLCQWTSEYPHFARLIRSPGWRTIFQSDPPPQGGRETDAAWIALRQAFEDESEQSTGDESSTN